ncbi:MAG: D-alanyl-D-alanine carboxypeptidase [Clostridia bacterium]|nr:D-alanyl-D-alanine carboxypeptidase [Clostridia bacterium]
MFKKFMVLFLILSSIPVYAKCQAPSVSAKAAVVIEADTGNIVYSKNHNQKLPMASTTKIMTAICAIENTNTNIPITVSDKAVGIEGSSIYLKKNEVITIKELLYGLMLNSGNDAAVAIAVAVSGTVKDFAELMNKTAQNIGAKNTSFTNPSGLYEENHYTTAWDLALISAYAMKNPLFREIVSTKEQKISNNPGNRYLKNHNKLLRMYEGCIGVKTGYTKKCGRCLVSAAQKDGVTLVAVTLNAPDDWTDHTKMLDYGFSKTKKEVIAKEGEYATSVNNYGVDIPLFFDESIEVSTSAKKNLTVEYSLKNNVDLPVNQGQELGKIKFLHKGNTVAHSGLIPLDYVPAIPKRSFKNVFLQMIKSFVS